MTFAQMEGNLLEFCSFCNKQLNIVLNMLNIHLYIFKRFKYII